MQQVFYLPMHSVKKESSTTTKIRVVFDASAKSSTGVSLNDSLLVDPTVHPWLMFYFVFVCISKMYRAIELIPPDRDLHRFVWRQCSEEPLRNFRMTWCGGLREQTHYSNHNYYTLSLCYVCACVLATLEIFVEFSVLNNSVNNLFYCS